MASAWARTRARERIVALGEAGLDDRDLRRQILTALGEVISFDFFAWLLTDPVTAVGAAPLAEVPRVSELPTLIKAKYATSVNRWTVLRRQASPVRLLSEATGGELARSRVWREVMSRHGVGDVASAVFADQYGCWGFLDLWRHRRHGPFDSADTDLLAGLSAPLARALRRCQARTFVEPAAAPSASPPESANCSACSRSAATPAPWPARCRCPSTRSRTTSNRSSPRRIHVIASPCCHEPSAPGLAMWMTDPWRGRARRPD
jgi:hypothetical protein